jgi:hypothetical protein
MLLRRRLRAARAVSVHRPLPNGSDEGEGSEVGVPPPAAAEGSADDARLDTLRGELVRELDRLASSEHGCSADFRRI